MGILLITKLWNLDGGSIISVAEEVWTVTMLCELLLQFNKVECKVLCIYAKFNMMIFFLNVSKVVRFFYCNFKCQKSS